MLGSHCGVTLFWLSFYGQLLQPVHTGDYSRRFRRQFVTENGDCQTATIVSSVVWTGL